MKTTTRALLTAPALGLTALLISAGPAAAADGTASASLQPIAGQPVQGASGQGMVEISGTNLSFTLAAQGLLADAPHAAHIHFGADARNECPGASDNNAAALSGETNPHEHFTTTEGAPAYGEIVVSLTKTGDASPQSGLAVDRFAVGSEFEYSRGDAQVTPAVADAIVAGKAVVVVHGVDYDGDGTYSAGERGMSDLDPKLPGEATDPALCGVLNAGQMGSMPNGGVDAGAGSTTGVENAGLMAVGGLAAVGGAALLVHRRRTSTDS
ncbi:CHRD domain-containing protein [Blastococcus atacamensis]|uniref:CHRD domain-containing protein n=1 Tax=Blastococcus atacamensis TaxID=2070508 RepID=UPI0018E417C9|nr:CHRD domain-containing protein [Blastococcus atacamensis]